MPRNTFQPEFGPPRERAGSPSWGLALLAHGLLLAALAWGTSWKRHAADLSVEAEIWASVPVQQAPPPQEPVAPPAPPSPTPAPPPVAADPAAQIAIARAEDVAAKRQAEAEAAQAKRKAKAEQEARDRADKLAKAQDQARKAEAARQQQLLAQRAAEAQAEADRLAQLRRLQGLASGSVAASGTQGQAARSAGPSDSYAGRVRARVKPNIVYADTSPGNPQVEVEVRLAPDGTIIAQRVVKASGAAAWDDAVLRALEKTQVLPRDLDGRVPANLVLVFRPRD